MPRRPAGPPLPKLAFLIQWHHDPVRGVIGAASNGMREEALSVTDNGVHRTVTRWASLREALTAHALLQATVGARLVPGAYTVSKARLTAESRALLEWAQQVGLPAAFGAAGATTEGSGALLPSAAHTSPTGRSDVPSVTYDGFKAALRESPHSQTALHARIVSAIAKCVAAWHWAPTGLTVQVHRGRTAMGLAFNPGRGLRRISLAVELLTQYDLDSIERTVLHELAHHAREEMHPRPQTRWTNSHDAKFCEMLAQVDEELRGRGPKACQFFTDTVDVQVVAAAAEAKGIVYAPGAGRLVLGHSARASLRWRWEPTGSVRWKAPWQPLRHHNALVGFLRQFPVADRGRLVARYEPFTTGTYFPSLMPDGWKRGVPAVAHDMLSARLIEGLRAIFNHAAHQELEGAMTS